MISKINKIRNLGLVFSDYSWDSQLPVFRRYNLIYGLNFTGKTTLSRLFNIIENGNLASIPNLEYEIEDDSGTKYKESKSFTKKIRVFNQDYKESNLEIRDCKAKTITLILGDVNKEISEQLERDKNTLKNEEDQLTKLKENLNQKKRNKDKTFSGIAKTIYVAITGGAIRTYRKNDAESNFGHLSKSEILSEDDLNKISIVVKQNPEPMIDETKIAAIELEDGNKKELTNVVNDLTNRAKLLLTQTVESQIIERIKGNKDISDWVETGLDLHSIHKSTNCEFCGQILPKTRLKELSNHFSEADRALKQKLNNLLMIASKIHNLINSTNYPDHARFYDEIQNDYQSCCNSFDLQKDVFVKSMQAIEKDIEDKKARTTEAVEFDYKIDAKPLVDSFQNIVNLIKKHNKKTNAFENEKNNAIKKLKNHYLSTIYDEVKNLEKEIQDIEVQIDILTNGDTSAIDKMGIIGLKKRITENQAKISSTHKACGDINKGLKTFLGRAELVFEPHKTKLLDENGKEQEIEDGYVIKRNGKLANYLSEGEKTAIAFVYFIIHLSDQDFDIGKGIIVIDDPVSSLDSNSLFQAFSFLKNSVLPAEQVFILTHNFDFMRLLINWMKDRSIKDNEKEYFMIKNEIGDDGLRVAYIDKLDKLLKKHETEYQYLFSILKSYQSDQSLKKVYPMPNIARKYLETFLAFRVPNSDSFYKKLKKINYDKVKKNAIYKFANHECHITGKGFDPSLVPEADKVIPDLLDMVRNDSSEHYKLLEESLLSR